MGKKSGGSARAKRPREEAEDVGEDKQPKPATTNQDGEAGPSGRPIRVYADGIFDMFHFGHARALEQAKKLFPNSYLLVGVCSDAVTHRYKGKTVMTEDERYESVRHCKWVDEVVKDAPWVITKEFLDQHNIDYVAHDDLPYADNSGQADDIYGPVKAMGKFKATKRTEGVSTSDLILRILKDYNEYVLRNLSRGYSRKDLGVSLFKEQRIRASHNIKKLSQRITEQRLRVADRITKRIGIKPGSKAKGAVAAALEGDSSPGDSPDGTPRDGTPGNGTPTGSQGGAGSRGDLADMIRRNGEELATSVEQVVDKMMRGEYGKEVGHAAEQLTVHMDKFVSGCFRGFEDSYNKLEKAIKRSMDWKNKSAAEMEHASRRQRRRRTTLQLMARNSSSDLSSDEGGSDEEGEQEVEVQGKLGQEQQPLLTEAAAA